MSNIEEKSSRSSWQSIHECVELSAKLQSSHQFIANATRLIVNNTETQRTNDPQDWIVDSAANEYITPFKEKLHNYCEYPNQGVQVKGFAGKAEIARGRGTMILTDNAGNRLTLKDVVYVPESPDQILFLMKLPREKLADFRFMERIRYFTAERCILYKKVS